MDVKFSTFARKKIVIYSVGLFFIDFVTVCYGAL